MAIIPANERAPLPGGTDAKVTPEMAVFMMLDELNSRVQEMTGVLRAAQAEGHEFSYVLSATTTEQDIEFDAVSYTLVNDGSSDVYTYEPGAGTFFKSSPQAAALKSGESESVHFGKKVRVHFKYATASGTATLRLRGHF